MKYTHLGKAGVTVSRLCLGTMNFGPRTSEADSFAVMDKALDLGLNFFDTADVYGGGAENRGLTETIVGKWLAQGGGRRDAIVLATKVYNPMGNVIEREEINKSNRNLSKYKIIAHCEGSLKRLQTERIDLYQMHHIDRDCPHEEYWEAFEILQKQGKVLYVGSSNFAGWDIATSCLTAEKRGLCGLASEQSIYHLGNRHVELEVVPACLHFGLGIIPWSPLGGGLLGGVLKGAKEGRRSQEGMQKQIEAKRPQLEKWEALCDELGHPPAKIALAWLLHRPGVTAPIIGPRTLDQLTDVAGVVDLDLDGDTLEKIDAIWPGFGAAPNHYAW